MGWCNYVFRKSNAQPFFVFVGFISLLLKNVQKIKCAIITMARYYQQKNKDEDFDSYVIGQNTGQKSKK
jgi:hypothetical protein